MIRQVRLLTKPLLFYNQLKTVTGKPFNLLPRCRLLSYCNEEPLSNNKSPQHYQQYLRDKGAVLNKLLTSPNRIQKITNREDRSDYPLEALIAQGKGKYLMQHRGCSILKGADDMVIFQELFWRLRPATVIELGKFTGGSAVWMADMLRLMEVDSTIYSMDIELSNLEGRVKEINRAMYISLRGTAMKSRKHSLLKCSNLFPTLG